MTHGKKAVNKNVIFNIRNAPPSATFVILSRRPYRVAAFLVIYIDL